MNQPKLPPEMLDALQRETFDYFVHEVNPLNGLVADKTQEGSPASIAAVGLALSAYPVGVERGFITRAEAVERTLATLRFFRNSSQGKGVEATGYKGFYYHFLDMKTGRRVWNCELSTVDTAFLLAGMLTAAAYFANEKRRTSAKSERWPMNYTGASIGSGPRTAGRRSRMVGSRRAAFCRTAGKATTRRCSCICSALVRRRIPLPAESYSAWTSTYQWRKVYDHEFLYAGPLFIHQLSHLWVDFRGIQDAYMRGRSIDYFENSRRATYVQQQYAIRNPGQFDAYGENCWGITASEGPGWVTRHIKGKGAAILRLPGAGRARRPRRWHHRALGCGRLAPLCAGDRAVGPPVF